MKIKQQKKSGMKRRKLLPFLSSLFFLPFISSAKTVTEIVDDVAPTYQTMLTKDGKAVQVRTRAVNDSKVVDKQLSNKSLLKWLKKDEKEI